MSGEVSSLAADRELRMSEPDRLTSDNDKTFDSDTRGLILRIVVIACLGVLFWQAIIGAGML
jgi:hypothetical protein